MGPLPRACALLLAGCCLLTSCTTSDAVSLARVASGDTGAAVGFARNKAIHYAVSPNSMLADYRRFRHILASFRSAVGGTWGKNDVREAQPKEYVKYTDNYLSRASVDFEHGRITVETLDQEAPQKSLREAIVTTLLTPYDPRAVDMYSSGPVKLGGTPFLLGEVKDGHGRDIETESQAEAFARLLLETSVHERPSDSQGKTVRFVVIPMVTDHLYVRAVKFRPLVEEAARRFNMSRSLIYAVIRVESDFNPYAINSVPAVGLMQVVPHTAGAEVQHYLTNKSGEPSKVFLFEPENNVLYGTAYLSLLEKRHLSGVADPVSREYCVIASYNGGSGALLRTFSRDRNRAVADINSRSPLAVYETITQSHAALETREYLRKVLAAKKQFVGL
ncbi:MAG: murein transglycosylase domain-containing protein [Humidesulfovibrio sp.]|nr:murein transglycosylase domain-containing protein [Humidesulfovibrio sp.]